MTKLKDKLWLWGQDPGTHHDRDLYHLPGTNRMDSAAGCRIFQIPNCYRVCLRTGPFPPFDAESAKLTALRQVVWSAVGGTSVTRNDEGLGDLPEVLRQARLFPNVSGAVLDDFFSDEAPNRVTRLARHSLDHVRCMSELLHDFPERRLDFHLVVYAHQLEMPIGDYLKFFDILTFWTWKGRDLPAFRENLARLKAMAPGFPVYAGCYLWDYGESQALTPELMQMQLDFYREGLVNGELDGLVICSNCCADLGLETVTQMGDWLRQYGEMELR